MPPVLCSAANWADEKRVEGLQTLVDLAADARYVEAQEKALLEGECPLAPQFSRRESTSLDAEELSTAIDVEWSESKGSEPVLFYVLESCGASCVASCCCVG